MLIVSLFVLTRKYLVSTTKVKDNSMLPVNKTFNVFSLPEDYRCGKSLGPVESLQEHPRQAGKILIGYSRGLVVLWDVSGRQIEQLFFGKQVPKQTRRVLCVAFFFFFKFAELYETMAHVS